MQKGGTTAQEAKLLGAREADNTYFIEYTIKKGEEPQRHLMSTIAVGFNGRY